MIGIGDFVWYKGKVHVVLAVLPLRVEWVRFGDKTKTTFWTLRSLMRPLSQEEVQGLMDAH